jgi:chemosensory pili system protein ChpA (sensor histidine kinase/response regulator)
MEVVISPQSQEQDKREDAQQQAAEPATEASVDNELLGVFLEEYETVVQMLNERIPQWLQNQENSTLISDIRRGFHTLKGSGRMVGADELGDFAWHIEEMLNNMLDRNIGDLGAAEATLQLAHAALPSLKQRLLEKPAVLGAAGIEAIATIADDLNAGNPANWPRLNGLVTAGMLDVVPGGSVLEALPDQPQEPSSDDSDANETLNDLICSEYSSNLAILTAFMDEISRNRNTVAEEKHVIAAHTIAGTAALEPLNREPDVAKALEGFLAAQRASRKAYSDTAMWTIATTLAHLSSCLAVHQGDEEAASDEDEENQIAQLLALTVEYEAVPERSSEPEEEQAAAAQSPATAPASDAATADDSENVDTEILALFLQEASDILAECDSLLNSWRDNVPELRIVQILQREIHTFKGGARMSGVSSMGDLSHAMETLLEQIAGKVLTPTVEAIEALEQGCDKLTGWIEEAARGKIPQIGDALLQFEAQTAALLTPPEQPEAVEKPASKQDTQKELEQEQEAERKKQKKKKKKQAEARARELEAQEASEQADAAAAAAAAAAEEASAQLQDTSAEIAAEDVSQKDIVDLEEDKSIAIEEPDEDPDEKPVELPDLPADTMALENNDEPGGTQQIRVSADLLDSLINSAGEISIFRSRLEQQVTQQRETLKEFDETVSRLREQFRKQEIETETQIRSRYQQENNDVSEEFDPLELDRFSSMQQLSRSLSESVSDLLNLQELLDESARKSEALLVQQSRVSTELQEGLMQTRMVHFASIAPRLRRVVRAASTDTGKKALLHLRMTGGGDQLDRNVLERITAPLEHLLRNALAHGIEAPKDRKKLGKPIEGDISITVASEATEFVVRVEDDGGGLDLVAIKEKAILSGLIDKDANPSDQQLLQFILQSGFSTSKTVTGLSGRGVGMDVVNSEIKQIGGSMEIDSETGKGSRFTIRIPFTLAVMQAIGVTAGEHRYLIPLASVAGVARILPAEYQKLHEAESPVYEFAGDKFPVLELEPLLGEPSTPLGDDTVSILLIKAGEQRAAFRVPELLGHREIVIKPVGPQISSVPGILGGTITGDGQVVIIIDSGPLIRQALITGARAAPPISKADDTPKQLLALVVDDSITMRKVTSRVLEGHDFEVITARDGIDATEQMQDRVPDLLLLDVEMPRMDGYQVAEYVRADARLRDVPIIMITSRAGEKHRERGKRAGADGYITKPYKENDLLDEVKLLLRQKRLEKAN